MSALCVQLTPITVYKVLLHTHLLAALSFVSPHSHPLYAHNERQPTDTAAHGFRTNQSDALLLLGILLVTVPSAPIRRPR